MGFCCRLLKFHTRGTRRLVRVFVLLVIASVILSILTARMKGSVSDPLGSTESISRSARKSHFNLQAISTTYTKTTPSTSSTTDALSQRESSTTTEVPSQQESRTNAPMRYKLAVGIAVAKRNPPTIYRLLEEIFRPENDLRDVVVVVHVAYDVSKDQELLQALHTHELRRRIHVDIQKEPHPQADPKNIPSTHGDTMERTVWRTTAGIPLL